MSARDFHDLPPLAEYEPIDGLDTGRMGLDDESAEGAAGAGGWLAYGVVLMLALLAALHVGWLQ